MFIELRFLVKLNVLLKISMVKITSVNDVNQTKNHNQFETTVTMNVKLILNHF